LGGRDRKIMVRGLSGQKKLARFSLKEQVNCGSICLIIPAMQEVQVGGSRSAWAKSERSYLKNKANKTGGMVQVAPGPEFKSQYHHWGWDLYHITI
jgi:hypothetical protein